jgi:hypothetical protein
MQVVRHACMYEGGEVQLFAFSDDGLDPICRHRRDALLTRTTYRAKEVLFVTDALMGVSADKIAAAVHVCDLELCTHFMQIFARRR